MKKLIYHIVRLMLGFIPAVLTVAPAMAQKPVQHIVVNQTDTIEFSVEKWPGDDYTWDIYDDPGLNFAEENERLDPALYFVDGMYRGSTVLVTNLPPGQYYLRVMVWDELNCTNNLALFSLEVKAIPEADLYGNEACFGDPTYLHVVLTGVGPWNVTYTDGTDRHDVNLDGNPGEDQYILITPNTLEPNNEVIIREYWLDYIEDLGTGGVNTEPTERARIVIYPIPSNSKIYIKEDEQ